MIETLKVNLSNLEGDIKFQRMQKNVELTKVYYIPIVPCNKERPK